MRQLEMPRSLGIVSHVLSGIHSSNSFTRGGTTLCLPICHFLKAQLARVTLLRVPLDPSPRSINQQTYYLILVPTKAEPEARI